MSDTQEPKPEAPSRVLAPFLCAAVLLPILYVLSVGPVVRIYPSNPPKAVLTIYAPIEYLAQNNRPFGKFITWYLGNFWRPR